jgi:hypothetical protein
MPSSKSTSLRKRILKRNSSFSDYDHSATTPDSDGSGAALDNSEIEEINHNKREMQEKPKDAITLKKILIRSATAIALACLYMSIVNAGHFYCILAVAVTQVLPR